ncbi:MAG: hypothetical protein IIV16_04710 [Alistipes sp.]|nr:hypothetical protein [Alistipes sp.]
MLRRVSILSLMAILFILSGEDGFVVDCTATQTMQSQPLSVETSLDDTEFTNPASILSGQTLASSQIACRRVVQRTGAKRSYCVNVVTREETKTSILEHLHNSIGVNILGGIVANRAFYSLCCLRI